MNLKRKLDLSNTNIGTSPVGDIVGLIKRFWALYGDFKVAVCTNTTFTITVPSFVVANRTLDDGLWNIVADCLTVHRRPSHLAVEEIRSFWVYYWVQMYGVPLEDFSFFNARIFGQHLGEVIVVDDPYVRPDGV